MVARVAVRTTPPGEAEPMVKATTLVRVARRMQPLPVVVVLVARAQTVVIRVA